MTTDITFIRAYQDARLPMQADRGALGYIPVSAFQYCEAMRVASGMGWYIFPPKTISLMFDGKETFIADDGQWRTFTHEPLEQTFLDHWDRNAPEKLRGHAPSYIRRFSQPGIVQIWSGFFAETMPDLWLHIRPIVNKYDVSAFSCFEAIVETDSFKPAALFMNIQITRTNSEILIEKDMPLFQVCAVEKSSVQRQTSEVLKIEDLESHSTYEPDTFWSGLDGTVRVTGVTPPRQIIGNYAVNSRKRDRPKS
jgi:Family of unknown function (DUF6065)